MRESFSGLAVFDLDGTRLRGPTICEVLARTLGRLDHMRQWETHIWRAEMLKRDRAVGREPPHHPREWTRWTALLRAGR
jgi:hypothetical protein